MTTPAELRALADRVCAEEPSDELSTALMRAMPDDVWSKVNNPLHSRDDAAAMMPAGWMLIVTTAPGKNCTVDASWDYGDGPEPDPEDWRTACAVAPTEPRARAAAALRVRAAMMEDGE